MYEQENDWQEDEIPRSPPPYPDVNDPHPTSMPVWIYILWGLSGLACLGGLGFPIVGLILGGIGLDCAGGAVCGSIALLGLTIVITLVARDQIGQSRRELR